MEFKLTPEEEAYRQKLRDWLKDNLPEGYGTSSWKLPETWEEKAKWFRIWHKKLFDAGYAAITWPKKYGGQEGTEMQHFIVTEELGKLDVVDHLNAIGFGMAGPTIFVCGTEKQKEYYLPRLFNGEHIWCQGFSEPNAGSDLAALTTRAVRDGDDYVINGQKVWTSMAHIADYCILVVRTNTQVPKHKGLSYFIVPMKTPGITVRPLRQITGESEFNEVYFDDTRIPREHMVGEENQGWQIAITTLMYERSGAATYAPFRRSVDELMDMAKKTYYRGNIASKDPIIRQKLAQFFIEVEIMKYNSYRSLTKQLRGEVPGPEGSIGKLYWSEFNKRMQEFAMEIQGPYHQILKGSEHAIDDGKWQHGFLRSRANTIEAGTSEIVKNIIGERVLGLPKDAARQVAGKK